jgi:hypothetical protein
MCTTLESTEGGLGKQCRLDRFAALPPDVRKLYDLPVDANFLGLCPVWAEPHKFISDCRWGGATTAHQTAEPYSSG